MQQYRILLQNGGEEADSYPIADRSPKTFRELRRLQIQSPYYGDEDRYRFAREMKLEDEFVAFKSEDGETVRMNDPELSVDAFLVKAAELLFPNAPIVKNADWVDLEVAGVAVEDFTGRIVRKRKSLTDLFA